MKNTAILTCLILLFTLAAYGQNERYKIATNLELKLYKDLMLTFKYDSFVVSPLVDKTVYFKMLDTQKLICKYGFSKKQFRNSLKDTILIKNNRYFEAISPDSIIKFSNLGLKLFKIDSTYIMNPYYYFIEKTYNKRCVCEFNKIVFSKNKMYAVAEYFIACGPDDGIGETVLMRRTKNKWVVINSLIYHGS
jgi:hypothetical protein